MRRKKKSDQFQPDKKLFKLVAENIDDLIAVLDLRGRRIYNNPAYQKLLGDPEALIKTDSFREIHPDDREKVKEIFQKILKTGVSRRAEYRLLLGDGSIRYLASQGTLIRDGRGKPKNIVVVSNDVSEKKEAERQLRLLAYALTSTRDFFCLTDLQGNILFVNPSFCETYGYSEGELIGKNVSIIRSSQNPPELSDHIDKETLAGGWKGELINRRKNGSEFHVELWTSVVFDDDGKPIAFVGIGRDNTERRKAEKLLKETEQRLRNLVSNITIVLFTIDSKGIFTLSEGRGLKSLGLKPDEVVGRSVFDVYRDVPSIITNVRRALAGEEFTSTVEVGDVIFETHYTPVFDANHTVQSIIGVATDVTARRRAEQQLVQSEGKYRTLFEESQDGIYFSTPDGKLLDLNPAAMEIFGITSEDELEKIDIEKDFYFNPVDREIFKRNLARQGFVTDFENVVKRKDGQKRVVLETASAVRDAQGKVIAYRGFIRDMTDRKILEEQLRQSQKMESIGTLAGGIAHDFNNILGIISGYAQVLTNDKIEREKFIRGIEVIKKAVDRGATLVKQMLTFARRADVASKPLMVNDTIHELAKMFAQTFPKSIKISLDLNDNLPYILADAGQLHQAILNLSINARDAMVEESEDAAGGSTLTLSTTTIDGVNLRHKFPNALADKYVMVSVGDTGMGMDEATKVRMFEPFFTTKGVGKGTGLGLAVVYGFVNSHHGYIDVESTKGVGTTFHLYFPVQEGIDEELPLLDTQPRVIKDGSETLLIVEDEDMLLDLLTEVLQNHGYKVLTARDGLEAIRVYERNMDKVTLVLSDMGLPKLGGWEMFLQLKKMNPDIKLILASGYLNPQIKNEMLQEGAKDFIQKPYIVNEILYRIRDVIDSTSE
ncbi:MAG TPA: PAS domain S-box protein [Bacteroidota bacterium]|nr:PAS domain S-box protein [Bacteroidota bacterium]